MQEVLKFGVLSDDSLIYVRQTQEGKLAWCKTDITFYAMRHIGDICELALAHNLQRIWIHLSNSVYSNLSDNFILDASSTYVVGNTDFEKFAYYNVYRKQEGYAQNIGINFNNHLWSKWNMEEYHKPKDVYIAIAYLEKLLDIPLMFSTGWIGQELIKVTNSGKKVENIQPCTSDLSLFIKNTGASSPWHRGLTDEEKDMKWLHMIDKNANFLAASNIQLGIGNYDYVLNPSFSKYDVGLWHVTVNGTSQYEGVTMPLACTILQMKPRIGWIYTATVQLLIDLGYHLTFHAVYIWPKPRRTTILDDWSKLFSTAYTALRTDFTRFSNPVARGIAQEALKGMYVKGLSFLSMDRQEISGNYIDRPDWYHLVIADAYQRMVRNIITFEKLGLKPVIMAVDALCYPSNEADITLAIPQLRMEKKSGHYKLEWSIPMEEARHLFEEDTPTSTLIAELKKIAEKRVTHA